MSGPLAGVQRRILNLSLRLFEKPYLRRTRDPAKLRAGFERKARVWFRLPRDVGRERIEMGGVPSLRLRPPRVAGHRVLLYFHGGGYVFGSSNTHAALAAYIGSKLNCTAVLPDYRLAPEHPFPAFHDDALAAYAALIDGGSDPADIVIGGDSAGGGLALSLLGALPARGLPRPAGLFAFSPVTDLTFSGPSIRENARAEVMLPAERLTAEAAQVTGGTPPEDPRLSPLFADFTGAPPVFLTVGTTEILRDDTLRLAARLRAQGVAVALDLGEDLPHVWPLFFKLLPQARATLADLDQWIGALPDRAGGS